MQNSSSKTNSLIYWVICNKLPSLCIFTEKKAIEQIFKKFPIQVHL